MRYIDKIIQYGIIYLLATPFRKRKGGENMQEVISFVMAVAAGVVSYYICKWLDSLMGGK